MKISFNQLDRGYSKYKDEYSKAALETLESGWYILGEKGNEFERSFADFIGANHCVGLNSGLDALVLAFRALEIGEGDEVIVPANTYIASALGVSENGAIPVFVEPNDYYNLCPDLIEDKITDKTKAILVVHLYGQAANMKSIKAIADKHGLYLIEDCAQSHGASFAGQKTGTWGDIGCFSFYPTKNIGAFGDSGAVVTNNQLLYERIKMLRNYGSRIKYQNEMLGVNSRMDEIQAALLLVKLSHYSELRSERESIAKMYLARISNPLVELPKIADGAEHVWHLFVVRASSRNDFQEYLSANGISTQIHYPIPPHLSAAYSYLGYISGSFPITENYSNHILSLPLYEGMTKEEINYVIDKINNYAKG